MAIAEIKSVGVIGAGQMGTGIAHVWALAGYDVKLNDLSAERIEEAIRTMRGNMTRQVARGIITDEELAYLTERIEVLRQVVAKASETRLAALRAAVEPSDKPE